MVIHALSIVKIVLLNLIFASPLAFISLKAAAIGFLSLLFLNARSYYKLKMNSIPHLNSKPLVKHCPTPFMQLLINTSKASRPRVLLLTLITSLLASAFTFNFRFLPYKFLFMKIYYINCALMS